MKTADERRLWSRWRAARDEDAFERLVEPHVPFAIDLARRLGCDAHDADDVAQQSLVALAATRDDRPPEVGVRAWLGRRVSLDVKTLRRAARRRRTHEERAPAPPVTTAIAELDNRDAVDAALARLDEPEREIVILRFLHDLEYREVAYVLGITPTAARIRVHRALRKLRQRLGKNASALIAAGALWTGSRPVHALVQGVWLMSKSVKITLAAVVALFVALLTFQLWGSGDGSPRRAPAARTANTERAALPEPDPRSTPPRPEAPDAGALADAKASLRALDRGPWSAYESRRVAAGLQKQTRDLRERVRALAPGDEPEPRADSTALLYLEELQERYRGLTAGDARLDVLTTFARAHRRYLDRTHDLSLLPFLDGVIANGTNRERVAVVSSLSGVGFEPVVDALLRAAAHPDAAARQSALGALAEVRGAGADRAHRAVVSALHDTVADVRWSAALELEFACGTASDVPALLDGIGRETDRIAMYAMISAVRALDPEGGEARVDAALASAPAGVRAAGDAARSHEPDPAPLRGATPSAPATDQAATADPGAGTTRDYLTRLGEELLTLAADASRERRLAEFASTHAAYARRTRRTDLLPLVRRLVDGGTEAERRTLLGSLGRVPLPAFVKQLVSWSKDPEPSVRAAAGQGLVRVRGDVGDRARTAALALLDDDEPRVRMQVAMAHRLRNEPEVVAALIGRLAKESDYPVTYAIVITVLSMDASARERIEDAATSMDPTPAKLVARALADNERGR